MMSVYEALMSNEGLMDFLTGQGAFLVYGLAVGMFCWLLAFGIMAGITQLKG